MKNLWRLNQDSFEVGWPLTFWSYWIKQLQYNGNIQKWISQVKMIRKEIPQLNWTRIRNLCIFLPACRWLGIGYLRKTYLWYSTDIDGESNWQSTRNNVDSRVETRSTELHTNFSQQQVSTRCELHHIEVGLLWWTRTLLMLFLSLPLVYWINRTHFIQATPFWPGWASDFGRSCNSESNWWASKWKQKDINFPTFWLFSIVFLIFE